MRSLYIPPRPLAGLVIALLGALIGERGGTAVDARCCIRPLAVRDLLAVLVLGAGRAIVCVAS